MYVLHKNINIVDKINQNNEIVHPLYGIDCNVA